VTTLGRHGIAETISQHGKGTDIAVRKGVALCFGSTLVVNRFLLSNESLKLVLTKNKVTL